ncbi:MAG: Flp pilus assembly protein CpaB [Phyllobacteriaceae bacterium]|nr:Flp pilus assembly protein CpaB [Phyllobacteriaceae bacterium]
MKASRLLVLLIALIAGLVAAMLAVKMSSKPEAPAPVAVAPAPPPPETVDVLVAAADLPMGKRTGAGDFTWQPFPKAGIVEAYVTRGAKPDAPNELANRLTKTSFYRGEPIHEQALIAADRGFMSVLLTPGMRATAVEVKAVSTAGGFVLPNDHVDILLTRAAPKAGNGDAYVSETILTNIRVLAVDQQVNDSKDAAAMLAKDTVTLELTPRQAETVAQAQQLGVISLALRSMRDRDQPLVEDDSNVGGAVKVVRYGVSSTVSIRR